MPVSLPNLITIARILIVPLAVWFIIGHQYGLALLAFRGGRHQRCRGWLHCPPLQPAIRTGFLSRPHRRQGAARVDLRVLAILQVLPNWLAIIVVTRDVLIVGAVLLAQVLGRPLEMKPLQISKINTVAQILFAARCCWPFRPA